MSDGLLDPDRPLGEGFRRRIEGRLEAFLGRQREQLQALGPELGPVQTVAAGLLRGGKRLRPAFCAAGYLAAADDPPVERIPGLLDAAASLELLHVSALVHDDVMDGSDLRRGRPAAHRQFEAQHRSAGWCGDPAAYGRAAAILLGDLLLMWSVEMLAGADLPAADLARAAPIAEAMRTEVTAGQYLDVLAAVRPLGSAEPERGSLDAAVAEAARVVEFKSARYTVSRPAQLGAALGGGSAELAATLGAYGGALGRAFQYRDDLLGVFGDPAITGKPAGDDLREGKRTVLVAYAYGRTDEAGRALLRRRLGDPGLEGAGVEELRGLITGCGAREAVEREIGRAHDEAVAALRGGLTEPGRTALVALAAAAVQREA